MVLDGASRQCQALLRKRLVLHGQDAGALCLKKPWRHQLRRSLYAAALYLSLGWFSGPTQAVPYATSNTDLSELLKASRQEAQQSARAANAHAPTAVASYVGWEAGRLDYEYGASEVAAFVNTQDQVQLQIVLCALNEASSYRMSVLLPHPILNSGIIPVKLHVDGTVTHVYAEVVGNALEFQIDSAFLITLPDSPTFELEFSAEDAAYLKLPQLLSFPMTRSRLVLTEVARSCKVLSEKQGFECAPELISGILWPRHGFNSAATLSLLARQDPDRVKALLESEQQQFERWYHIQEQLVGSGMVGANQNLAQMRTVFSQRFSKVNGLPVLAPIDLARLCLQPASAYTSAQGYESSPSALERLAQASKHSFAPSIWVKRAQEDNSSSANATSDSTPEYSFVLSAQCRMALDWVYERSGHEALSFLRQLFTSPQSNYQHYAKMWRTVMQDAARMDFENPNETSARLEREIRLLQDYDYYLALYTLFSSGRTRLQEYPQSYYDIMRKGKDLAPFLYALDNRYELETVKYASVLVRRLTNFITPRRNVEEALTSWWSFYQELSAMLPPLARAQALRPVLYRQMLMRLWRQAGFPQILQLRPELAFVQGHDGKTVTGESLEAKCSIFEGTNGDQFFFASPECQEIVTTDMRLLGYNNEDLHVVWRNWHEYMRAWQSSPFAKNTKVDSAIGNLEANHTLTLLSLYKTYGFGDYYLLNKCISSRDSDICAYETYINKESYQSDLRRSIAAIAKVSPRDARTLSELDRLWQRYYESLCVFTNNLVSRGMLSSWRAPFVQGVAVAAQAEAMLNGLNPEISSDEF